MTDRIQGRKSNYIRVDICEKRIRIMSRCLGPKASKKILFVFVKKYQLKDKTDRLVFISPFFLPRETFSF